MWSELRRFGRCYPADPRKGGRDPFYSGQAATARSVTGTL